MILGLKLLYHFFRLIFQLLGRLILKPQVVGPTTLEPLTKFFELFLEVESDNLVVKMFCWMAKWYFYFLDVIPAQIQAFNQRHEESIQKCVDTWDWLQDCYEYYIEIVFNIEPRCWLLIFLLLVILPVFIIIAYSTLLERKLMASIQRRQGPNVVGVKGLLQPLADGLKLLIKEFFWPKKSYFGIYFFAAGLGLMISLYVWLFLPLSDYPNISVPLLILVILAIQIVETYSLILAGWSSNSKYALLGALRTTAQMISYELALSFIILTIVIISGSLDLYDIVYFQSQSIWFFVPLLPLFGLFLCASLAETNRTPFDLPEAEAELVAGYNVEYSGMLFALFFLAEYANMAFLSTLISLFFLGGWTIPGFTVTSVGIQALIMGTKTTSLLFFFIWVRATLPRYRYDQLMDLGWKVFLPITFAFFVFVFVTLYFFGALPVTLLSFFPFL